MSTERDSVEDLLALSRRGGLSDAEERRLDEVSSRSAEVRLLREAGEAFDREAPVVPGDDERIEAIVRRVEFRGRRSNRRLFRRTALAMAAGALLGGVAMGAMVLLVRERSVDRRTLPGVETSATRPRGLDLPAAPLVASSAAPVSSLAVPIVHERSRGAPVAREATIEPSLPSAVPSQIPPIGHFDDVAETETSTARGLFTDANRARVGGDVGRAVALYERLEAAFPGSAEAMTAHLSLGLLYLQRGQPAPALANFERCRAAGSPAVMSEALWGQARALRELGRSTEERGALLELARDYPSSPYASAAQKRLAEKN